MSMEQTIKVLRAMDACNKAVEWARTQPDLDTAWATCPRGDWMLWLLGRIHSERWSAPWRQVILAACDCARTALEFVPDGETRPVECIETIEAAMLYGDESAEVDLRAADAAAYAAADADADAAAYAANAAAYAANAAAYAAARAAVVAAYAAAYAANAAASAADARVERLALCADLVRERFPVAPVLAPEGESR